MRCPPSVTDSPKRHCWIHPATSGQDFALNPEARRNVRPNRVRYPTDCMFASGCSPPRLAAGWRATRGEHAVRRVTNTIRPSVATSQLIHGEVQTGVFELWKPVALG